MSPMPPNAPAIIDIEASGFGRGSYPIEIGVALPDGSSFCTLVRPAPDWTHWDDAAMKVHGIPRETVMAHGRDAHEVARMLNERLRGLTVYSDAWYHDFAWLNVLYEEANSAPNYKLDHLARLLDEPTANLWNDTRAAIEREQQVTRHRASADARMLQLTWVRLCGVPEPKRAVG
ncbi:MAG: hypothetical protein REI94_18770 [Moraxellaceae bacterium]|nr:hypothetical protein [Moraxellaceae bacterium]